MKWELMYGQPWNCQIACTWLSKSFRWHSHSFSFVWEKIWHPRFYNCYYHSGVLIKALDLIENGPLIS